MCIVRDIILFEIQLKTRICALLAIFEEDYRKSKIFLNKQATSSYSCQTLFQFSTAARSFCWAWRLKTLNQVFHPVVQYYHNRLPICSSLTSLRMNVDHACPFCGKEETIRLFFWSMIILKSSRLRLHTYIANMSDNNWIEYLMKPGKNNFNNILQWCELLPFCLQQLFTHKRVQLNL